MKAAEHNGRIRLTWSQATWCMAVLVVLIGGWYRIESRLATLEQAVKEGIYSKAAIDGMLREVDRTHEDLLQQIKRVSQGGER